VPVTGSQIFTLWSPLPDARCWPSGPNAEGTADWPAFHHKDAAEAAIAVSRVGRASLAEDQVSPTPRLQ
jgi:hypothetical protein